MPFGLTKAPMTFQRLIDSLFGPEFQPNVFGYLDNIIIATETFEEHQYWVELVLKRLVEVRMKANIEKCEVCCSRVAYLEFLLDREGMRPYPEKVASTRIPGSSQYQAVVEAPSSSKPCRPGGGHFEWTF